MTRLLGPDMGSRTVFLPSGAPAAGKNGIVYADAAGTMLADIRVYDGTVTPGAAYAGSVVTVDAYGLLPLFWFPDGLDKVWIIVNGGPLIPINADYDARLDTVTQTANAAETPAGAQAKADAAQSAAITVAATDATTKANAAQASATAASVPLSLMDAKGDLIVGSGNDAVTRLPVGADRRVPAADSSQSAGIRWTDPLGLEFVTTSIQGSLGTGSNAWPVANDARYARVLGSGTISKIGLEVMAQSGNICVAVYSKTGSGINAQPGTRVATSGAIACPPVGYVEISLGGNVVVSDGDYLALSCDNAVAAVRGVSGSVNRLAAVISYAQSTAHPLPPTATPVASASRIPLLIGIP